MLNDKRTDPNISESDQQALVDVYDGNAVAALNASWRVLRHEYDLLDDACIESARALNDAPEEAA